MYPPFRTKVIEKLPVVSRQIRIHALHSAGYNPFHIPADCVTIDLVSDSGTSAMSATQWQAIIGASEDFSGQHAHMEFVASARRLFGMRYVQPVHQGRVAENLLFRLMLKPGDAVASNTHFETTRDNIESLGCSAIDMPDLHPPYCGNLDVAMLSSYSNPSNPLRMIILTITNNIRGGQPVSLQNMQRIQTFARHKNIPVVFDASRFPDNAYFIKKHSRLRASIRQICKRMFTFADTLYLSCKKSVMVNVGGCIATRSRALYEKLQVAVLQQESYPTSGGLAARDLAAMTQGLREALDEQYIQAHMELLHRLGHALEKHRVMIRKPIGGHGIAIRPKQDKPHAAFALAAQVYLGSGIRGGVFDGHYRLAIPRRVYSLEHLKYVAQAVGVAYNKPLIKLQAMNAPSKFHDFLIRFKKT